MPAFNTSLGRLRGRRGGSTHRIALLRSGIAADAAGARLIRKIELSVRACRRHGRLPCGRGEGAGAPGRQLEPGCARPRRRPRHGPAGCSGRCAGSGSQPPRRPAGSTAAARGRGERPQIDVEGAARALLGRGQEHHEQLGAPRLDERLGQREDRVGRWRSSPGRSRGSGAGGRAAEADRQRRVGEQRIEDEVAALVERARRPSGRRPGAGRPRWPRRGSCRRRRRACRPGCARDRRRSAR